MKLSRLWLPIALVGLVGIVAMPFVADELSNRCMPWQTPVEVHLKIESALAHDGRAEAAGTTDLPDGAVVAYFFLHNSEAADLINLPGYQAGGEARVVGGSFSFVEDLSDWPHGAALMDVWFQVGPENPQPPHVIDEFGENGQCMTGPQVGIDSPGDPKVLHTNARVTLPDSGG
jgi:hypothetical protein